jgi:hypothetical protein
MAASASRLSFQECLSASSASMTNFLWRTQAHHQALKQLSPKNRPIKVSKLMTSSFTSVWDWVDLIGTDLSLLFLLMAYLMWWPTELVRISTCHLKSSLWFKSTLSRTRLRWVFASRLSLKKATLAQMWSAKSQCLLTPHRWEFSRAGPVVRSTNRTMGASCGDSKGSKATLRVCWRQMSSWFLQLSANSGRELP